MLARQVPRIIAVQNRLSPNFGRLGPFIAIVKESHEWNTIYGEDTNRYGRSSIQSQ